MGKCKVYIHIQGKCIGLRTLSVPVVSLLSYGKLKKRVENH